jgi:hypothetical protein
MATTINAATTGLVETSDGTAVLDLQTGGTTALRVNASQAIGVGSTPAFGTAGQFLTSQGNAASPTWTSGGSGTVTSVGWTGGIVTVATATTTPAFTIAGTSGGIPYFDSASTWTPSAVLAANSLVKGGGAGAAPSTTTTGTGVLTALGNNVSGSSGIALVTQPQFTNTIGVGAAAAASGSGVSFPATQSASSDVNTLDDYEEGTFTPTITFGGGSTGITYSTQVGSYTKIGNKVFYFVYIILTSKGSSTGAAQVAGMPFTASGSNAYVPASSWLGSMASLSSNLMIRSVTGTTTLDTYQIVSNNYSNITDANFTNSTLLQVAGFYTTA